MGLLTLPKHYKPRKGAPRESLLYVSDAEKQMLKAMTDGKLDMTRHGVLSAYAEASGSGNYKSSTPSQSGTRTGTTTSNSSNSNSGRGTTGMQQGSNNYNSNANAGTRTGTTTTKSNTNSGNTGTGGSGNLGRGGSGIGGGVGFGRDPAMGSNFGRGTVGMQQGPGNFNAQPSRSIGSLVNGSAPQYSGPARYSPGAFNDNASQQVFGGYPNSLTGMMPKGQVNGFATQPGTVNPMAPQARNPSYFGDIKAPTQDFTSPEMAAELARIEKVVNRTPMLSPATGQPYGIRPPTQDFTSPEMAAELARIEKVVNRPPSTLGLQPPAGIPTPRQNPLSDPSKFTFDPGRPRDSIFKGTDITAVSRLAAMQDQYGGPLRITSGYRSPALNAQVGGAKKSQHLQGNAFDVHTDDPNKANYARLAQAADDAGFTGIGAYRPGSLHVDTGPARAWGPSKQTAMNAINGPRISMAGGTPPKATVLNNVVKPAIAGIQNMLNPPSVPKPRPNPMRSAMINPAAAPPTPQVDTGESWLGNVGKMVGGKLQQANVAFTDANQKINALGGGERVAALARTAQSIMDHLSGFGSGGGDIAQGGNFGSASGEGGPGGQNSSGRDFATYSPPISPLGGPQPPVNPVNPMQPWLYPQYQSAWANLPVGIGGYARG